MASVWELDDFYPFGFNCDNSATYRGTTIFHLLSGDSVLLDKIELSYNDDCIRVKLGLKRQLNLAIIGVVFAHFRMYLATSGLESLESDKLSIDLPSGRDTISLNIAVDPKVRSRYFPKTDYAATAVVGGILDFLSRKEGDAFKTQVHNECLARSLQTSHFKIIGADLPLVFATILEHLYEE